MAINKIRYSTFRHVKSAFDQEKADKRRSLDFIDLVFSTFELHVFHYVYKGLYQYQSQ